MRAAVEQGDSARLLRTLDDAPDAHGSHPTPEHFWPLLVAAGTAGATLPAREDAAALLILRQCMHHLGYADIRCVNE